MKLDRFSKERKRFILLLSVFFSSFILAAIASWISLSYSGHFFSSNSSSLFFISSLFLLAIGIVLLASQEYTRKSESDNSKSGSISKYRMSENRGTLEAEVGKQAFETLEDLLAIYIASKIINKGKLEDLSEVLGRLAGLANDLYTFTERLARDLYHAAFGESDRKLTPEELENFRYRVRSEVAPVVTEFLTYNESVNLLRRLKHIVADARQRAILYGLDNGVNYLQLSLIELTLDSLKYNIPTLAFSYVFGINERGIESIRNSMTESAARYSLEPLKLSLKYGSEFAKKFFDIRSLREMDELERELDRMEKLISQQMSIAKDKTLEKIRKLLESYRK
jgi:hypothetical protein